MKQKNLPPPFDYNMSKQDVINLRMGGAKRNRCPNCYKIVKSTEQRFCSRACMEDYPILLAQFAKTPHRTPIDAYENLKMLQEIGKQGRRKLR